MNPSSLAAAIALGLSSLSIAALAQTPGPPDRPGESVGPTTAERKCDALTGAQKEQCLRNARRPPQSTAQVPRASGSCDALYGPEKEMCIKRGGTIEAGTQQSGAGSTSDRPGK
jgi:hypothetical protein